MERHATQYAGMDDLKLRIAKAENAMQQVHRILQKDHDRSADESLYYRDISLSLNDHNGETVHHAVKPAPRSSGTTNANGNGISLLRGSTPKPAATMHNGRSPNSDASFHHSPSATNGIGSKDSTISAIDLDNEQMRMKLTELRSENMDLMCQHQEAKLREEKLKAELFALKNRVRLAEASRPDSQASRERELEAAFESRTRDLRAEFEKRVEAAQRNAERAVRSIEAELEDVRSERDAERRLRADAERQRDAVLKQLDDAHTSNARNSLASAHADGLVLERDALRAELQSAQRKVAELTASELALQKRLAETNSEESRELRRRGTSETAAGRDGRGDRESSNASSHLQAELDAAIGENRRLAALLSDLNAEREGLIVAIDDEKDRFSRDRARLEEAAANAERSFAAARDETRSQSQKINRLEQELHDRQKLLEKTLAKLETLEAEKQQVAASLERSNNSTINELRSQLATATKDLHELDAHSKRIEQALQDARELLRAQSSELAEARAERSSFEREIRDAELALDAARKQVATMTKLRDDCLADMDAALRAKQEAETRCRRLEEDAQRCAAELRERVAALESESTNQMRSLANENERLRGDNSRAENAQHRAAADCQRLADRTAALERELEEARRQVAQTTQELAKSNAAAKQTRDELQQATAEGARFKADAFELQAEHERLLGRLEECAKLLLRKEEEVRAATQQSTVQQAARIEAEQRTTQRIAQLDEELISVRRQLEHESARLHEALAKLVASNAATEAAVEDRRRAEIELRAAREAVAERDGLIDNLKRSLTDCEQTLLVRDSTITRLELRLRAAEITQVPAASAFAATRDGNDPTVNTYSITRSVSHNIVPTQQTQTQMETQTDAAALLMKVDRDLAQAKSRVPLPYFTQSAIRDNTLVRRSEMANPTAISSSTSVYSSISTSTSFTDSKRPNPVRPTAAFAQDYGRTERSFSLADEFILVPGTGASAGGVNAKRMSLGSTPQQVQMQMQAQAQSQMQMATQISAQAQVQAHAHAQILSRVESNSTISSPSTADTVLPIAGTMDSLLSAMSSAKAVANRTDSAAQNGNADDAESVTLLAQSEHAFTQAERDILKLRDRLESLRIRRVE